MYQLTLPEAPVTPRLPIVIDAKYTKKQLRLKSHRGARPDFARVYNSLA